MRNLCQFLSCALIHLCYLGMETKPKVTIDVLQYKIHNFSECVALSSHHGEGEELEEVRN